MNRNVLLLSIVAAFAGAAGAQSSVTIYGRVNTSVESQKTTGVERTVVLQNNSSRWGLRGSEDLGGGMKAFLQLESGFGSDTGQLTGGVSRPVQSRVVRRDQRRFRRHSRRPHHLAGVLRLGRLRQHAQP